MALPVFFQAMRNAKMCIGELSLNGSKNWNVIPVNDLHFIFIVTFFCHVGCSYFMNLNKYVPLTRNAVKCPQPNALCESI